MVAAGGSGSANAARAGSARGSRAGVRTAAPGLRIARVTKVPRPGAVRPAFRLQLGERGEHGVAVDVRLAASRRLPGRRSPGAAGRAGCLRPAPARSAGTAAARRHGQRQARAPRGVASSWRRRPFYCRRRTTGLIEIPGAGLAAQTPVPAPGRCPLPMNHRWLGMVGSVLVAGAVLPTILAAQTEPSARASAFAEASAFAQATADKSADKTADGPLRTHRDPAPPRRTHGRLRKQGVGADTSSGTGTPGIRGSGMAGPSRSVNDSGGSSTRRSGTRPPASTAPCPRRRTSGTTLPTSCHTRSFSGTGVFEFLPGSLAGHGACPPRRFARAHNRGPQAGAGEGVRSGARRGPLLTRGRRPGTDGCWREAPALRPPAPPGEPGGPARRPRGAVPSREREHLISKLTVEALNLRPNMRSTPRRRLALMDAREPVPGARDVRGACPLDCPDTCSWIVTVRERRRRRSSRRSRAQVHPRIAVQQGCGLPELRPVAAPPAVSTAPVGSKGSTDFTRISWDEALERIATEFHPGIATARADDLALSRQRQHGPASGCVRRGRRFWNCSAHRGTHNLCTIAGGPEPATPSARTASAWIRRRPVLEAHCDLGANVLSTHPHLWRPISRLGRMGRSSSPSTPFARGRPRPRTGILPIPEPTQRWHWACCTWSSQRDARTRHSSTRTPLDGRRFTSGSSSFRQRGPLRSPASRQSRSSSWAGGSPTPARPEFASASAFSVTAAAAWPCGRSPAFPASPVTGATRAAASTTIRAASSA